MRTHRRITNLVQRQVWRHRHTHIYRATRKKENRMLSGRRSNPHLDVSLIVSRDRREFAIGVVVIKITLGAPISDPSISLELE